MALRGEFGVEITYQVEGRQVTFLRRFQAYTRQGALIAGINELIQMGVNQNFVPVIEEATSTRLKEVHD